MGVVEITTFNFQTLVIVFIDLLKISVDKLDT